MNLAMHGMAPFKQIFLSETSARRHNHPYENVEAIHESWLCFKREYGSVDDLDEAQMKAQDCLLVASSP